MDIFITIIIAIIASIIAILISEIVCMRSRLDYLERNYIEMKSDINNLYIRLRG